MSARLLGLLALIAIVTLTYWAYARSVPFLHGYQVKAVVSSSSQLINGAPVRVAGVNIGKVAGISAGPGVTTLLTLDIRDEARPVHSDATIRIRPRLFLEGGFYVDLRPGTPSAPELSSGGTIPLSHTSVPVQFHQILATLDRSTRDGLASLIRETSTGLKDGGAKAIGDASRPLIPVFRDTARISEAAQGSEPHDASDVVGSASRLAAALGRNEGALADLVTGFNRTTTALAAEAVALGASVREFDGVVREAPEALTAFDASFPSLRRFSLAARPGLAASGPVFDQTADTLVQLRALLRPSQLPRLVRRLKPTLRGLPTLEDRLTILFPLLKPVTDCLRDRALPVLTTQLDDGSLSTGQPVWKDGAHGTVGFASLGQDFDANGFAIRYLAGGGDQGVSLGPVPDAGALLGASQLPILGSRPRWLGNGVAPPLRPDQRCVDQAPPDLRATAGPPPASRSLAGKRPELSRKRVLRILRGFEKQARAKARRAR